jgi:hypothetical protein
MPILKAPDEAFARLSAERWFGYTGWQIAEIRRVDMEQGAGAQKPTGDLPRQAIADDRQAMSA